MREWLAHNAAVRDGQIRAGATDAEIETLIEQAELRGLHVDSEVVEFLRMVNGTAFDGLNFFGAAIPEDDSHGRIDFIRSNDTYNDQPSRYTHYGISSLDLYRFDNLADEYQLMDNSGGGIVESFPSFGLLVDRAIKTIVLHTDA